MHVVGIFYSMKFLYINTFRIRVRFKFYNNNYRVVCCQLFNKRFPVAFLVIDAIISKLLNVSEDPIIVSVVDGIWPIKCSL